MEELIGAIAASAQNLRWMLEKSLMGLSEREEMILTAAVSTTLGLVGEACSMVEGRRFKSTLDCLEDARVKRIMPVEIAEKILGAEKVLAGGVDEASLYYLVEGLEELAAWLATR